MNKTAICISRGYFLGFSLYPDTLLISLNSDKFIGGFFYAFFMPNHTD